jgi:heme/copper-type cytochrome/quinol oxidase subunit 2
MSAVMIPGLWNYPQALKKGKTVVMEFTPSKVGTYQLTCAMGVP